VDAGSLRCSAGAAFSAGGGQFAVCRPVPG
jgi:hypothetical protein